MLTGTRWVAALIVVAHLGGPAGAEHVTNPGDVALMKSLGYIVVTPQGPNDGGDYGPSTKGTKTGGIQEALNAARDSHDPWWPKPWSSRNVYIARGLYKTSETITIPYMGEDWVMEARGTFIHYKGKTGDAIVIDSQMNNQIKMGYIVCPYLEDGAVVHLRPTIPFPNAPRGVITNTRIEICGIVGSGDVVSRKMKEPKGIGLYIDATSGPILDNVIFVSEINASGISLLMTNPDGGGGILSNTIEVPFNHLGAVALQMGLPGQTAIRDNIVSMMMEGRYGASIAAQNNTLHFRGVDVESGEELVFECCARDNIVYTTSPLKGVVNRAVKPTNRIVPNAAPGYGIPTPEFPASGEALANRTCYRIEANVTRPGKVTEWTRTDADGASVRFEGGLAAGQSVLLEPGESVSFIYSEKPEWKWRGLR